MIHQGFNLPCDEARWIHIVDALEGCLIDLASLEHGFVTNAETDGNVGYNLLLVIK